MKLKASACGGVVGALTAKCVAAAALTAMALLVPVMMSGLRVGGRDGLAAGGLERDGEGADAVGQRGVSRQGGLAVAAGEVDGAGVAGGCVVELIESRHGDVESSARGRAARCAMTAKCVAAAALTAMVLLVPVIDDGRCRWR